MNSGVLDKADLAEVYNVKKSKHKGDNLAEIPIPVKAVEFKEAVLEQLLPAISDLAKGEFEPQTNDIHRLIGLNGKRLYLFYLLYRSYHSH